MPFQKSFDPRKGRHEGPSELRNWRMAHNDQQGNAMVDHRLQLVWGIADAMVVGERDPASPAYLRKPLLVGRTVDKVIGVPFNRQPGVPQDVGEPSPQIAIREIDKAQAARS